MSDSQPPDDIAARLNAGADSAAAELDEQYRARLCRLVEREMNCRFRRKEDPEDVVQSAFRTFYRRNALGEFHIDSTGDLWRLLATITRHKILKHVEKLGAGKRDPKREEHPEGDNLPGRDPAPEEAAITADLMEHALAGLDEIHVQVFHLRLQNCTEEEIAAALGCTRAFVRTRLQRIRERLQRLSEDDVLKSADLSDLLRHCLAAPASEYLRGLAGAMSPWPAESAADSPSESAAAAMPLGELFQSADPPLGLLIAVKRRARRLMGSGASDVPVEIHQVVYFAAIAAALVRHGELISKSGADVLRIGWERLAAEPFLEGRIRRLFEAALERVSEQDGRAE
jgi:RNA polymerase sigma-70 factor (ECF subfamily)